MENAKKKLIAGLFQTSLFPAVILAGWFYYPVMEKGPVLCLFRNFVGVKCYGCGMTRAVCEAAHGHVAAAMQQNKLVIPLLTVLFILSYVGAMNLWKMRGKRDVVSDSAGARPVVNLSTPTRPLE